MKYFLAGAALTLIVLVSFVVWKWRNIERFIVCGIWGSK